MTRCASVASLLIRGATILTMDREHRVLRGDLRVDGGTITHVGEAPQHADTVIEAAGDVLLPGLVNAHTHAAMTLFRGLGDDLPLEEWLSTRIWPNERKLTRPDVAAGSELAILEMARAGVTAFNDMYFFADETARAAKAAGMRAHIGATLIDFDTPELKVDQQEPHARAFHGRWRGDALITPTLAPHATYSCSDATLERVHHLRDELGGCILHTHCSETRFEVQDVLAKRGARPVEILRKHGLLSGSVLAHCGWVTKDEIRTFAHEGASVAHCPVSNMKLATGGTMPMSEMQEAGVNIALGTDGAASNNTLDVLETAKFAALAQKQHRWDARAGNAHDVLRMATVGGARALALPAAGLVSGAAADLCLVSTRGPHLRPLHDPASALVYQASASDVRATIVAGRPIFLDGAFPTMKPSDIIQRAETAATNLARLAAG